MAVCELSAVNHAGWEMNSGTVVHEFSTCLNGESFANARRPKA
jgi:hypothetical protein